MTTNTHIHTDQHMLSHLPHTLLHLPIVAHGNTNPPQTCTLCSLTQQINSLCFFPPHLSITAVYWKLGLCWLLVSAQPQVEHPPLDNPPPLSLLLPVRREHVRSVPQRCPDMEQELLARLSAYHSPHGVNQLTAGLVSTVCRGADRFMRGQPPCEPGRSFTSKKVRLKHCILFSAKA